MNFLAFDIGNSNVVVALHDDYKWHILLRMPSEKCLHVDYFISHLEELAEDLDLNRIDVVVISSVVPKLTQILPIEIESVLGVKPFVITPANYNSLKLDIDNPLEIGTDLVANAMAAHNIFDGSAVVVDFGTALTFTIVDNKGRISGVAIAPGVKTAMKSLSGNTALLPEIPLELPDSVIGKNTVHAMQAGIMHGFIGLVKGILKSIKSEIGDCKVVATGGMSQVMTPLHPMFDEIVPYLTLEGMKLIYLSSGK